jgi:hypothetical protein
MNLASPAVPLRRITSEGANHAAWMDGGQTIGWSFANHYHRATIDSVMKYPDAARWNTESFDVTLTVPRANPQGRLLLRGARIITMRGDEVIEKGDVLVRNNRIEAVAESLTPPAGTRVIDVTGRTIMPGLVDVRRGVRRPRGRHLLARTQRPRDRSPNIVFHTCGPALPPRAPSSPHHRGGLHLPADRSRRPRHRARRWQDRPRLPRASRMASARTGSSGCSLPAA